jgi:CRP/FNR family cyclic AMP-dependent transcriptional regulator
VTARLPRALAGLREVPLFEGLSDREIRTVSELLHEKTFPAGVEFIVEDQPGEVVYLILSGSAKVHLEQADGTEVILAILAEEEVLGEMSLVDSLGRSATATTLEETRVVWLDRDGFWGCLRSMPILAANLQTLLARRLRMANTHVEAMASLDVKGRVARHLLSLAFEYGRDVPGGREIPIPLTQADLAALVGASRVRVNQVLGQLRRRREITWDRAHILTVLDPEALRKRCR